MSNPQAVHPLVALAKRAVEEYVHRRVKIEPTPELPQGLTLRAGTFVSLKMQGELRGCIGTIEPAQQDLAHEVIENAIGSATRDPRFPPVTVAELDQLQYSVDVLSPLELVRDLNSLDAKAYGVVVEAGWRRGVLLPDIEGVETVAQQLAIACAKAGIRPSEPIKVYRFDVERFS